MVNLEPIKKGNLQNEIRVAYVEFLDTGEKLELETKNDSSCHFFSRFCVENDEIQLRLDWSDIDNNNPVLDADFYCKESGKKKTLKGERKASHHTSATSESSRQYEWSYKEFSRPFRICVGWLLSAEIVATSTMTATLS